jgi:hypothetical protein
MTVRELREEVDPSVRWQPEVVPPGQNGWRLAVKAAKLCPKEEYGQDGEPIQNGAESPGDVLSQWADLHAEEFVPRAKAALGPYAAALATLQRAIGCPRWVAPEPPDDVVPNVAREARRPLRPVLMESRALSKALILRARVALACGESMEAAADLLRVVQMGRYQMDSSVISYLVGIAVHAIGCRVCQRWVREPAWSDDALLRILDGLAEVELGVELANTLRKEMDGYFLRKIAGLRPKGRYAAALFGNLEPALFGKILRGHANLLDRHETAQTAGRVLKLFCESCTSPWEGRDALFEKVPEELTAAMPRSLLEAGNAEEEAREPSADEIAAWRKLLSSTANPIGKSAVEMAFSLVPSLIALDRRTHADHNAARVAVAAELYRRRRNCEPPTLEALVGEGLLPSVPRDPFGNGPLHYDPKRRLVWSVGENGKDDGGLDAPGMAWPTVKDYVWPTDGQFDRGSEPAR